MFDLDAWSDVANKLKPVLECLAFVAGFFALIKLLWERNDRSTQVLLQLEEEFDKKCKAARPLIENSHEFRKIADELRAAWRQSRAGTKEVKRQVVIDDLLRFYVVLCAVRQARQVSDSSLSICYRYWLAHYYHTDRTELRDYVDELYPTVRKWLHTDTRWYRRFRARPISRWWRSFFRPEDFWDEKFIARDRPRPSSPAPVTPLARQPQKPAPDA